MISQLQPSYFVRLKNMATCIENYPLLWHLFFMWSNTLMIGPHLLLVPLGQRGTVGNVNSSMGYVTVSITVTDGLVFHTLCKMNRGKKI